MQIITFLAAGFFMFLIFEVFSNPKRRIYHKFPTIKIKWVQVWPNIRIHIRGRVFCIHHWMSFTLILVLSFYYNTGVFDALYVKGALVGGILQGLTFPDWKSIIKQKLI